MHIIVSRAHRFTAIPELKGPAMTPRISYVKHRCKLPVLALALVVLVPAGGFAQNAVTTRDYLARIADGRLATAKGYAFTEEDRFRADIIERIMCDMAVDLPRISRRHGRAAGSAIVDRPRIENLIADGVVTLEKDRLSISDGAEFLVRSVASAFDAHLPQSAATHSRAV